MTNNDAVLVTGSAGFIGQSLVKHLREIGRPVVGLDRNAEPAADALRLDLTSLTADDLPRPCPPTIVHLAALSKEPGYPWRDYFANNAEGTRRLCEAADEAGVTNIVFTSSMMAFASGPWRRSESDFGDADTAYGGSKLQAEEILRTWQVAKPGRRLRIVRPGVVFGPGDQGNMRRLIHGLSRGRFAYIGREDTVKSCIYLKDMVRLLVRLIEDDGPHDTYHAVYPEPTTIRDHVDAINRAWGWDRHPRTVPYRFALAAATPFALVDPPGTRFGVHPRRIQKLHLDTNISSDRLADIGFTQQYSLSEAFADWRQECGGGLPQ
ncbi:N-acetyl-alpha-D-glucosaminyl-diphospho-ditrans, octacis-undecaprenol 4-epimerase [Mycolicibacterium poriferae]|uniref:N-acetyl-alpha-D-glucosaminyl-diphospho-ditrans, o ctacis-undecaprenol 4-epimerase n=1 Tax=Mycolicibacterium poriferae TaxID=39694 RepID=A0A6N4VA26_9MYCO|nr:NAD(P)-dependent oxidoreductase [Mycolicibacterium poriferae]MCV7263614.1 NAD(P)-dependent oxidoreductase [Mycolicibacterium poriferae]BBX50960.1 N-acetyl-alpha-D-glucosaminyl-diphospho-ditrans, o ctacis-undecaprenol 4-epimerase [Mycolicibacterium poriferae]